MTLKKENEVPGTVRGGWVKVPVWFLEVEPLLGLNPIQKAIVNHIMLKNNWDSEPRTFSVRGISKYLAGAGQSVSKSAIARNLKQLFALGLVVLKGRGRRNAAILAIECPARFTDLSTGASTVPLHKVSRASTVPQTPGMGDSQRVKGAKPPASEGQNRPAKPPSEGQNCPANTGNGGQTTKIDQLRSLDPQECPAPVEQPAVPPPLPQASVKNGEEVSLSKRVLTALRGTYGAAMVNRAKESGGDLTNVVVLIFAQVNTPRMRELLKDWGLDEIKSVTRELLKAGQIPTEKKIHHALTKQTGVSLDSSPTEHQSDWAAVVHSLEKKIPAPFFHTFIKPIRAKRTRDPNGPLLLTIPGEKLLEHIKARYYPIILGALRDMGFQGEVSLVARSARGVAS